MKTSAACRYHRLRHRRAVVAMALQQAASTPRSTKRDRPRAVGSFLNLASGMTPCARWRGLQGAGCPPLTPRGDVGGSPAAREVANGISLDDGTTGQTIQRDRCIVGCATTARPRPGHPGRTARRGRDEEPACSRPSTTEPRCCDAGHPMARSVAGVSTRRRRHRAIDWPRRPAHPNTSRHRTPSTILGKRHFRFRQAFSG